MFAVCAGLRPVGYSPWRPSPLCAATTNAYFVTRLHEARKTLTESSDPPMAVAREYVDLLLVMVRAWAMDRSSIRGTGDGDDDDDQEPVLEFCWSEGAGAVVKTACVRAELVMAANLLSQMLLAADNDAAKGWETVVRLQLWVVKPQLDAGAYMPTNSVCCGAMAHRALLGMALLRLQVAVIHQWEGKALGGDTLARLLCWATAIAKGLARVVPAQLADMGTELEALLWLHTATGAKGLDAPQKQKLLAEARDAFLTLRQPERVTQCERMLSDIAPRADEGPARIVHAHVVPKCVMLDHAPLSELYLPPEDLVRLWKSV